MTAALVALAAAVAALGGGLIAFGLGWVRAERARAASDLAAAGETRRADDATKELAAERAARVDERARLEAVITNLKEGIDACALDPADVRRELDRLFRRPDEAGGGVAGPAAGGVPGAGDAGVGTGGGELRGRR